MEAPNIKYLLKNEYFFINIGLSIRCFDFNQKAQILRERFNGRFQNKKS